MYMPAHPAPTTAASFSTFVGSDMGARTDAHPPREVLDERRHDPRGSADTSLHGAAISLSLRDTREHRADALARRIVVGALDRVDRARARLPLARGDRLEHALPGEHVAGEDRPLVDDLVPLVEDLPHVPLGPRHLAATWVCVVDAQGDRKRRRGDQTRIASLLGGLLVVVDRGLEPDRERELTDA